MAKRRYGYIIRVKEWELIKFAYPRATFPAAVRAFAKELEAAKIRMNMRNPTIDTKPSRKTLSCHQTVGRFHVTFDRIER